MPRHAEITLRYTIRIDTIPYKRLREWSERLHRVTSRRISRIEHSSLTVRTWHD